MPRCLLVDDDAEIRMLVIDYLRNFQIDVESVADAAGARRLFERDARFDLVLLDLMLPDGDGLELCRWLRQKSPELPIIMLTAQGDPISRVVGLEVGADDYIAKPFEPRELVARINAVLRRVRGEAGEHRSDTVRFGGWAFNRLQRELESPQGVVVPLSTAEFKLMGVFVDHPMRVLSRDRIIELTGQGAEVSDRAIDLAVSRLRQKLGDSAARPQLIRTVRGAGYQLNSKVVPA